MALARRVVVLLSMLVCSCSGELGSDVDSQADEPPVAQAVVIGNIFETDDASDAISTTVRAGSDVVLTGKESVSLDDPILSFSWSASNPAAEAVQLLSRNSSTVSFTAPVVASDTPLEFTLTVTDSDGSSDTVVATVNVVPVADPDLFLGYVDVPESFTVIASIDQVLTVDVPFEVSMFKRVQYTAQDGSVQTFDSEPVTQANVWFAAAGVDPDDPDFVGNPQMQFRIPRLILDEINRDLLNLPPLEPGRARILERRDVDTAEVTVVISATPQQGSAGDPSKVVIFLRDASGAEIPVLDQNLLPSTGEYNGVHVELRVPVEALNRTAGGGNRQENRDTARMYYAAIDPHDLKDTLSKWLEANCFSTDPRESYHADAHAVYTNNFDLGFGRDMYVKSQCAAEDRTANTTFVDGDLASVVINYASLEAAGKKLDPVLAVAMERRSINLSPITTFYAFAPDEKTGEFVRVSSADFDNRGERYLPGVCTVCHGGRPDISPTATTFPENGDVGAIFLPWDLDSFLYTDSDNPAEIDQSLPDPDHPLISPQSLQVLADFTRSNQEDDFKALNEAVLRTYPEDAPVRRLVHYWYHQPGDPEPDFASNELQSGTFLRDMVPPDWDVEDPDSEIPPRDLYLDVIAQNCRACHTQLAAQSHPIFDTFEEFEGFAATTLPLVFEQGRMPLARLTMDRFWASTFADSGEPAAEILRAHLAAAATPGDVSAVIGLEAPFEVTSCTAPVQVARGQVVRLSADDSRFAEAFQWQLDPVPGNIELAGADTSRASFVATASRNYHVTLEASNSQRTGQASCTILVPNLLPSAEDFTRVVNEGESVDISILEELLNNCPGGTQCTEVFGDLPGTVTVRPASAVNGSVTALPSEPGLVRFQSTTPDNGQFVYDLDDVDGDRSRGTVTVMVTTVPVAIDDSFEVDADSTDFPSSTDFDVTLNDGGGVAPLAVTAFTQPPDGVVSFSGNTATYVPDLGFVGTDQFSYTVTDSDSVDPKSDTATVSVTVLPTALFATDVLDALSGEGCLGCHQTDGFPGAPNWFDHSVVTGPNQFTGTPRVAAPAQAESSIFLQTPLTGSNVDGSDHRGGQGFDETDDSTNNPNFRTILRWIEEGARDN